MLKIVSNLFDRCMFTLTFILGVQLPEFLQQYSQRLSGHINEANRQLLSYQQIADNHYQGNLIAMINKYRGNTDQAIAETGDVIFQLMERISALKLHLAAIQQNDAFNRWYAFFLHSDMSIVQATLDNFQLAIPLEPYALAFGLGLALVLVIIEKMLTTTCIYTYRYFTPDMRPSNSMS